jgi:hypothetical protein
VTVGHRTLRLLKIIGWVREYHQRVRQRLASSRPDEGEWWIARTHYHPPWIIRDRGGRARGRVCPAGSGFAGGPVAALWVTGGWVDAGAWDRWWRGLATHPTPS